MDEYVVISIKATGDNPYSDEICQIGLIRYKGHAEVTRSNFYIEPSFKYNKKIEKEIDDKNTMPFTQVREAVSNIIENKKVIGFGRPYFLEKLLENGLKEVHFFYLDCKEYIGKVVPPLASYSFERLIEFFMLFENSHDACTECVYIQRMYMATLRFCKGKFIHELSPNAEYYLTGYWEKTAEPEEFARLVMFKNKKVLISGNFKAISRDVLEQIVSDSGGTVQKTPDVFTNIVIAGNTEFPATYQTRSFHDALMRIRNNQEIRVISELEVLSLLYGQLDWKEKVNPYYVPIPAIPEFIPLVFNSGIDKGEKFQGIIFPIKKKTDSENSRGNRKMVAKKILDAIRGSGN